jgi:hypothetical protein
VAEKAVAAAVADCWAAKVVAAAAADCWAAKVVAAAAADCWAATKAVAEMPVAAATNANLAIAVADFSLADTGVAALEQLEAPVCLLRCRVIVHLHLLPLPVTVHLHPLLADAMHLPVAVDAEKAVACFPKSSPVNVAEVPARVVASQLIRAAVDRDPSVNDEPRVVVVDVVSLQIAAAASRVQNANASWDPAAIVVAKRLMPAAAALRLQRPAAAAKQTGCL